MFLEKHYLYNLVTFRSSGRIGESGIWMGLLSTLELVFGLLLTPKYGLYGFYFALVLSSTITVGIMFVRQPLRCLFHFDKTMFKALAVTAFIMMGFGLTTIAVHNVDRVAILYFKGSGADLGQYHIASTISMLVSYLPSILLSVLLPNIFRFGSDGHLELRRYLLLPTAMYGTLGVGVVSLGWLVLPPFIHWFLPNYNATSSIIVPLMLGQRPAGEPC